MTRKLKFFHFQFDILYCAPHFLYCARKPLVYMFEAIVSQAQFAICLREKMCGIHALAHISVYDICVFWVFFPFSCCYFCFRVVVVVFGGVELINEVTSTYVIVLFNEILIRMDEHL